MGRFAEVRADPTRAPRTKSEAFKEGLRDAPYMALGAAMLPVDIIESGLDALRGVRSPNRMIQAASGWKQLFGGDPIPQPYERSPHEDWSVQKYELAGNLANPLAYGNPARVMASIPKAMKHGALEFVRAQAPAHVVKPKGGNWLSGSVEGALSGLKRGATDNGAELIRRGLLTPEAAAARPEAPINSWIEGPLTKYVKTRMASPDDEVRRLAEQGVLHVDPASLRYGQRQVHPSGEHIQKLAQTPDALKWENAADFAIYPEQARTFKNSISGSTGRPTIERNPWLANLSDDAPVYDLTQNMAAQDLGFPHLIDELSNALNPASGLPRNLLLTPEAVQNMSMEKAVRRVADINAWRAAQKVEANRKLAEQASMVREYAENNPKGLRWVQLKAQAEDDAARKALADQLKYEGDTMGHCVGGYCDDVMSGRSQIYSLRDAKGEPHVTVEVKPGLKHDTVGVEGMEDRDLLVHIDKQLPARQRAKFNSWVEENYDTYDTMREALENSPYAKFLPISSEVPATIVQIKGKQNKAPNPEYLPFVQDFVRNPHTGQPWAEVGDLRNTGMFKVGNGQRWPGSTDVMPEGFMSFDEASRLATERGMAPDMQQRWLENLRKGYASGGPVAPPKPGTETLTGGVRGVKLDDVHWSEYL